MSIDDQRRVTIRASAGLYSLDRTTVLSWLTLATIIDLLLQGARRVLFRRCPVDFRFSPPVRSLDDCGWTALEPEARRRRRRAPKLEVPSESNLSPTPTQGPSRTRGP